MQHPRVEKFCEFCGKFFDRPRKGNTGFKVGWGEYGKMRFCSGKCAMMATASIRTGVGKGRWVGGNTVCENCGKEANTRYGGNKGKMCRECYIKSIHDKNITYKSIHQFISRKYGKASVCVSCGETKGRIHWSNKYHTYSRNINDWQQLCQKCHIIFDKNLKS